ncbi:MAG: hypothetical protein R2875_17250 [Desulfobacterales bacterium]
MLPPVLIEGSHCQKIRDIDVFDKILGLFQINRNSAIRSGERSITDVTPPTNYGLGMGVFAAKNGMHTGGGGPETQGFEIWAAAR